MLPKIDELRNFAKFSNAVVIGTSESKLDDSFLSSEIQIDNYNILRCDWNRHGWGVDCYIRNDLSFDVKSFCQPEIENTSFKILLPNMKPTVARIIYRPPSQSKCLEITPASVISIQTIMKSTYLAILTLTSILITHTLFKK